MEKIEKIDYNYIISLIEKVQEIYEKGSYKEPEYFNSLWFRIYKNYIPEFVKNILIRPYFWGKNYLNKQKICYYPQNDDKKWSIDFINYILSNSNLQFDLNDFPEKDKKEILKFVRNKVFLAFVDKINKDLLFDKEDKKYQKEYNEFLKNNVVEKSKFTIVKIKDKNYFLPKNHVEIPLFFHILGLTEMENKILEKYKDKVALDCGAFIGDSALILKEYFNKVYALEPETKNFNLLLKTIKLNKLENSIISLKLGVGEKDEELKIISQGLGSYISKTKEGNETIKITTIDKIVNENNLEVGLIKMDIEGFELEAIKGAEKTIKEQKPILIISLYHRGKDFFEIPKLLKKWIPKYKFRFINLRHDHPYSERILLAYIGDLR